MYICCYREDSHGEFRHRLRITEESQPTPQAIAHAVCVFFDIMESEEDVFTAFESGETVMLRRNRLRRNVTRCLSWHKRWNKHGPALRTESKHNTLLFCLED